LLALFAVTTCGLIAAEFFAASVQPASVRDHLQTVVMQMVAAAALTVGLAAAVWLLLSRVQWEKVGLAAERVTTVMARQVRVSDPPPAGAQW
jgi:hypothetical protein